MLLQKPADRISLDAASAATFIAMLAEPYALEANMLARFQSARHVQIAVAVESGKAVLSFTPPTDVIPLDNQGVLRLIQQIMAIQPSPDEPASNPS